MCEQEWNSTYWDTEKWILSQDWHSIWLLHGDLWITGEITGDYCHDNYMVFYNAMSKTTQLAFMGDEIDIIIVPNVP